MQRHTKFATAGVACLAIAGTLYGIGYNDAKRTVPAARPEGPITVTATAPVCVYQDGKADRHCTPGVTNPEVTQASIHQTICVKGWTTTVRPPARLTNQYKLVQLVRYAQPAQPTLYEEDHLIPLELGGAPADPDNLWPQLWDGPTGAHTKDHEENDLHAQVCSGSLSLASAQQTIVQDWTH